MKTLKNVLVVVALLLISCPVYSFGPNGHRIVGQIAENHLTEKTKKAVSKLLEPESLAQVATWPDEIRSDKRWDYVEPWHYVTIEDGETYETSKKNPKGDVVVKIKEFISKLKNPDVSKNDKVEALKFLIHFIGDVHQPLHVGRGDDKGGNLINVLFFGKSSNLHSVWDSGLIESEKLSFTEIAAFIDHPSDDETKGWQATSLSGWVNESLELRSAVYDIGYGKISYEYVYKNLPIIKMRLLQAGVRAAGVLNSIFDPEGNKIKQKDRGQIWNLDK